MKLKLWILSLLTALPTASMSDGNDTARIVTGARQAAQCIAPIQVYKIDGSETIVPELGFEIEPGRHTIHGRANIDMSTCRTVGRLSNRHSAAPLEAEFEAGKTYYIGYDHSSRNKADWKIVIFRVEGES